MQKIQFAVSLLTCERESTNKNNKIEGGIKKIRLIKLKLKGKVSISFILIPLFILRH